MTRRLDMDQLPGRFEKRVFIGGNYLFMAKMMEIKSLIEKTGLIPILACDFNIPEEEIHDFSLRLLHNCRYAVFEGTLHSAELMELERAAKEYGTISFVLYEARDDTKAPPSQMSKMVTTLKIPIIGYRTFEELEDIIRRIFTGMETDRLGTLLDLLNISWLPPEVKEDLLSQISIAVQKRRDLVSGEAKKINLGAIVLINTLPKKIQEVLDELNEMSEVEFAVVTIGYYDIIIGLKSVDDPKDQTRCIIDSVRKIAQTIEGIVSVSTFPVIMP